MSPSLIPCPEFPEIHFRCLLCLSCACPHTFYAIVAGFRPEDWPAR